MEIDIPQVKAEVEAAFDRYERALNENDTDVLNELFHEDVRTIRYGIAENLYGYAEISKYRASRASTDLRREIWGTSITTYGHDFATAMTLFRRFDEKTIGRQSQAWVRFEAGWRIAAAHVSMIPSPDAK